ncbi:sensor histidine kinase [Longispora urticae]
MSNSSPPELNPESAPGSAPEPRRAGLGRGRTLAGTALAAVGLTALTAGLAGARGELSLASVVLLYLAAVVVVAVIGGVWPALAAAVASDLLVNFFFVPPFHTLTVESRDHVITLVVYVAVAVTVSLAVDLAARQRAAAARSGVEAALLARISAEPVDAGSLDRLLERVRDTFGMDTAALLETRDGTERIAAAVGGTPGDKPSLSVAAGDNLRLVVDGPPVIAADQRLLTRLAATAARALQAERLAAEAAGARELAEIDRLRAALLAAVGHDLRTPLAGIKAAVSTLREPEITLTGTQEAELLATVEESADRMDALVENLLAMSRLQAGVLSADLRPVPLDEIVATALLHTPGGPVAVDVPDDLPLAHVDPGLLERVVANLVTNARRASPPCGRIRVHGRHVGGRLELAVIDHGSGVPAGQRERMFAPFQRLGDHTTDAGLGLGLAIARGFTEAMGGTITPTDTPGGGLTMTVTLRIAP